MGAVCAFALLNLGAVLFGAAVATWIPEKIVSIIVAFLFAAFGLHALWSSKEEQDRPLEKSGQGIFFSTFLLIGAAEFGDKTQIAVAALSSAALPAAVWVGSTLALGVTSAIGVWAGRAVFQYIQIRLLHKIGGLLFIGLSGLAIAHVVSLDN